MQTVQIMWAMQVMRLCTNYVGHASHATMRIMQETLKMSNRPSVSKKA